jgi:hypothetical protein
LASSTLSPGDLPDLGGQADLHAAPDQFLARVFLQRRVERREQDGRHLDQRDVHAGQVDLRKRRVERGLPQLRERPGQLHAGRAAPHDREVHILARPANVQPLQPGHDVIPQRHRVPPRIQPQLFSAAPGTP